MKDKTNFWKRWYMIVLYIFVGLALFGVIFGEDDVKEVEVIKYVEIEIPVETIKEVEYELKTKTDVPNYEKIIREECEDLWDTDFSMISWCIDNELDAYDELQTIQPNDIPNSIFNIIKEDCEDVWDNDFGMIVYCIDNQMDAWRDIQ